MRCLRAVFHSPYLNTNGQLIIYKHMFERPHPLRQLRPDIPESIEKVVLRALEKSPEERQQSVLQLAQEFREAMDGI